MTSIDPAVQWRRRTCLQWMALPLWSMVGGIGQVHAQGQGHRIHDRRLVIITLNGGNDGLNTVVPWRDPLYRSLRPELAISSKEVLTLSDELGFHPSLKKLRSQFERGEVAVVQGVGSPQSDLSHFVCMDRWNAGRIQTVGSEGWFSQVVSDNMGAFLDADFDAGAAVLGADAAFTSGRVVSVLSETLVSGDGARRLQPRAADPQAMSDPGLSGSMQAKEQMPAAWQALVSQVRQGDLVAQRVGKRLADRALPPLDYNATLLEQQAHTLGWLMRAGVRFPVARLALGGFDTHSLQAERHRDLLAELDGVLARLREQLIQDGSWNSTLILVQSEFGRRVAEHSGGTDHGTAGVAFMLGGLVKGGLYGPAPRLDRLDPVGNLAYAIDFRSLYATVVSEWWRLGTDRFVNQGFKSLGVLAA